MSTVIILGDVHIGKGITIGKSGIGTALNSRVIDQVNLLDWTLEQALTNNSEHIIITGDIFEDPKPHPSLICLFIDWVQKCNTNAVQVHAIMGNHDALRTGNFYVSPLDILNHCELDNFHLYKDIDTITIDSTSFTLMPFRDRKSFSCDSNGAALDLLQDSLRYELAYIPVTYTKILIGHFALEGSIPVGDEIDDIANELFCPLTMFKGYDYVWMGHVHKPQVMQKSPYIAHIGSMDISNFGENEQEKYIVVFDTEDLSFEEVTLPTRPLTKISITIPKDTLDTTQFVLDELEKENPTFDNAIVRLEISLAAPELSSVDRSKIEKFIYGKGVFNISGFSESKKMALIKKDDDATAIDTSMDPSTAIKTWADKRYPDANDASKKKKYLEISLGLLTQLKNEGKE